MRDPLVVFQLGPFAVKLPVPHGSGDFPLKAFSGSDQGREGPARSSRKFGASASSASKERISRSTDAAPAFSGTQRPVPLAAARLGRAAHSRWAECAPFNEHQSARNAQHFARVLDAILETLRFGQGLELL